MAKGAPPIDGRNAAQVAEQVRALLRTRAPTWNASDRRGQALIAVFSRFAELIIERLNRVPEKNFLAFLDLLGNSRLPPQPAQVPLTFRLAEGAFVDAVVPKGTQVAALPLPGAPHPVSFETERELVVTAASLSILGVREPQVDRYSTMVLPPEAGGLLGDGFMPFNGDRGCEHVFYLGHRALLASPALKELILECAIQPGGGKNEVVWEANDGDGWAALTIREDSTQGLGLSGQVKLTWPAPLPEAVVNGVRSRWLRCRLTSALTQDAPKITQIKLSGDSEIPPDAAYSDGALLDLGKDFFPFGERPGFGNVFYIASHEALSRPGEAVAVKFAITDPKDYTNQDRLAVNALSQRARPTLRWEYWNGRDWAELSVKDSSNALTAAGQVTFQVPEDLQPVRVNVTEGYWLRVRIVAGNYGQDSGFAPFTLDPHITGRVSGSFAQNAGTFSGSLKSSTPSLSGVVNGIVANGLLTGTITGTISGTLGGIITQGAVSASLTGQQAGGTPGTVITGTLTGKISDNAITGDVQASLVVYRQASSLVPPCLREIRISVVRQDGKWQPESLLTYNDFVYSDVSRSKEFAPFTRATDEPGAFYLGFSLPQTPQGQRLFPNLPLSLYFSIEKEVYRDSSPSIAAAACPPQLVWEYWNGMTWAITGVQDETAALTASGLVTWLPPADICPRACLGVTDHFWLRARLGTEAHRAAPRINRVILNTTLAAQALTLTNEVLGSSNEKKDQRFVTTQAPVLPGQQLEVDESELPTAEEQDRIRREEGDDAVQAADRTSVRVSTRVRWHEVPDFLGSGPRDRHYVLDRLTGEIRFGDGVNGLIPPRGIGNIRLTRYRTGGGRGGNLPPGTVVQLQTTLPYVDQVINFEPATGGADAETQAALLERAPKTLRHRQRAVTVEDFEDLARLASPEVARALCVPLLNLEKFPLGSVNREEDEKNGVGQVGIIIVPSSGHPKPLPDLELIKRVQEYLIRHASPAVDVSVAGPLYLSISVNMEVALQAPELASSIRADLVRRLDDFLHPLTGGQFGAGWPFGEQPQKSDLYRLIANVPGIDHVRALDVALGSVEKSAESSSNFKAADIEQTGRFLIYSGQHEIRLSY